MKKTHQSKTRRTRAQSRKTRKQISKQPKDWFTFDKLIKLIDFLGKVFAVINHLRAFLPPDFLRAAWEFIKAIWDWLTKK